MKAIETKINPETIYKKVKKGKNGWGILVIENKEYFETVEKFAKDTNQFELLEKQLVYLAGYSDRNTRCTLYKDFAPFSFAFSIEVWVEETEEFKYWFNGGLIYHGKHEGYGSGTAPTFSISLDKAEGWRVHT